MNPASTKNKSKMSVRKDKDYRKLQQELTREKDKFDQHVAKLQRDLQDSQQQLVEEQQTRVKLAMEVCGGSPDRAMRCTCLCPSHSRGNTRATLFMLRVSV